MSSNNQGIMGRFAVNSERELTQYHMKIYQDQKDALDGLSKRFDVPMSEIVRTAIDATITAADDSDSVDMLSENTSKLLGSINELSEHVNKLELLQSKINELQITNTELNTQLDTIVNNLKDTNNKAYRAAMVTRLGSVSKAAEVLGVSRQTLYNSL